MWIIVWKEKTKQPTNNNNNKKQTAKQEVSGPGEDMFNTEQDWMETVDGSVLKIWFDKGTTDVLLKIYKLKKVKNWAIIWTKYANAQKIFEGASSTPNMIIC